MHRRRHGRSGFIRDCLTKAIAPAWLLAAAGAAAADGAAGADVADAFTLSAGVAALSNYYATYLANGYWSVASSPLGTDATVSQVAALMDYTAGDVSRPAAIPSWNEVDFFDGVQWLNAQTVQAATHLDYRQSLGMHEGVLTTHYRWDDAGRRSDVDVMTLVSQAAPHLAATSVKITPHFSGSVRLRFTLRPQPPPKRFRLAEMNAAEFGAAAAAANEADAAIGGKRNAIWYPGEAEVESSDADIGARVLWLRARAVGGERLDLAAAVAVPADLRVAHARRISLDGAPALEIEAHVQRGHTYRVTKFAAAATEHWPLPGPAQAAAQAARAAGFAALRRAHTAAWRDLWRSDVEVSGNPTLQRTLHSDLFYLLENTTRDGATPAAACGFSSNYFGHVFWDNDFWVFPALLLQHPARARSLIAFRSKFLAPARARAKELGFDGALYPWEADPATGVDVTPRFAVENASREIHVDGAVALAQWQYYLATGDEQWLGREAFPVMAAVADFWASRVTWNDARRRYEIHDVTSPEEDYVHVDNEIYTNQVAHKSLLAALDAARILGMEPHPKWREVASRLYLATVHDGAVDDFDSSTPHDKTTSWMATSVPMLSIPALDFDADNVTLEALFAHSARAVAKVRDRANQMILVMLAIQAANIGRTDNFGDVIGAASGAEDPFLKPPFNVRSETPQNDSTYLLASSGGFVQSFVYGLTGMRLTEAGLTPRSSALLPRAIDSLTLTGVRVRGSVGQVRLSRVHDSVVRRVTWRAPP